MGILNSLLELLNGGITAIKTSVDGTLFPVRIK